MANIETITVGSTTFDVSTIPANMEYSTSEKVVGTWVDGKTIYQKTIPISLSGKDGTVSYITYDISNVDRFISGILHSDTKYKSSAPCSIYKYNSNSIGIRPAESDTFSFLTFCYIKTTN